MLNALVPRFIKNIDKYFLLNHPILWISKIHYVLYYAIIMWGLSALIGFVVPVNLGQPQDIALWYVLFTILAIILFCVWIYKNAIFNVEKKFGSRHWTDEFKLFFLYFACIFIFSSFAYPFAITYNARVAHAVPDAEFIQDINTLNRAEPFIPEQFYSYYNYYDSTKRVTFYDINRRIVFGSYTPYSMREDTLTFKELQSDYQLRKAYQRNKLNDHDILEALTQRHQVVHKYGLEPDMSPAEILKTYKTLCKEWQTDVASSALLQGNYEYSINRIFDNISEAKFKTIFLFRFDFLVVLFYFIFYTALFFLLFRNTQWQHFLIMVITLIILPILLFIIGAIIPYSAFQSKEILFDASVVIVFIIGLVFSVRCAIAGKRFSAFKNISMQLMYVLLPVMPMFMVYFLKKHLDVFYNAYNYDYNYQQTYQDAMNHASNNTDAYYRSAEYFLNQSLSEYWQHQYDMWFGAMQVAGILAFILVFMPLMKELFVKQLALPRHK